jgi:hypothetical protein
VRSWGLVKKWDNAGRQVERFEVLGACIRGTLHGLTAENGTAIEIDVTIQVTNNSRDNANKGVGKTWIGDVPLHMEGLDAGQELRSREKPRAFRQG